MKTRSTCGAWITLFLCVLGAWAGAAEVELTIYSTADPLGFDPQRFISQQRQGYTPQSAQQVPGFAVVHDTRVLQLEKGANLISFTDVAQFIDPTTVMLSDLSVPQAERDRLAVKVLEQWFAFDLVSPQKLLGRYIDKQVTVNLNLGDGMIDQVTGRLMSANQGKLVLQTEEGLRMLAWSNDIQLGALPGGLITRPTLQWRLSAPQAGLRKVRTSYQTDGLTWRSDYNLLLHEDETQADLGAWVTILNLSGTRYEDAQLKLIAGDVQRFKRGQERRYRMQAARAAMPMADAESGFKEKSFYEYHLYTLPRRTTIEQNSTQQIALFATKHGINVEKVLVYYGLPQGRQWRFANPNMDKNLGQQSSKKVDVYIRFDNKQDNKLGIALPKGKVRVYKRDMSLSSGVGTLEFVGEDLIDHMSGNEQVLIKTGQAFDVVGRRVQSDFKADYRARWMEETLRITIANAKSQLQKVVVRENLYRWVNWKITRNTDDYRKIDSRTIHFEIVVPAEGEKMIEYRVRYAW